MGLIHFMFGGLSKFELVCCEKRLRAHLSLNVSSSITPSPVESAAAQVVLGSQVIYTFVASVYDVSQFLLLYNLRDMLNVN